MDLALCPCYCWADLDLPPFPLTRMKILCLHGMGTNSDIYEAQLAPIIAHMDPAYEFVFVDGLVECEPADNVEGVFPAPFYCYYDKPTLGQVEAAYGLIYEIIKDEGPFDGIFGFSQGAALAASLILHHQSTCFSRAQDDPFKFAVFMCASLPFSPKSHDSPTNSQYITTICPKTGQVGVRDWTPGERVEASKINGFLSDPVAGDTVLSRYHPAREQARIEVPTVHIIGDQDPFAPQGTLVAELCAEPVEVIRHSLGHQLPRDNDFVRKAVTAIEKGIHRALSKC